MKKNRSSLDFVVLVVLFLILSLFSVYFHRMWFVNRFPWLCGYIGTCAYRYDMMIYPTRDYYHKKRKVARGNMRSVLIKVGEIQNLVGAAKGLHCDDRGENTYEKCDQKLGEAFELCLEILGEYEPINIKK